MVTTVVATGKQIVYLTIWRYPEDFLVMIALRFYFVNFCTVHCSLLHRERWGVASPLRSCPATGPSLCLVRWGNRNAHLFIMFWRFHSGRKSPVVFFFLLQKESPDLSQQSPANGHASVTSSILVNFHFFFSLIRFHTYSNKLVKQSNKQRTMYTWFST